MRYLLICAFSFLLLNLSIAGVKKLPILPRNGDPVDVLLKGKTKHYFHLRKGYPLKFQVDGPGKIEIISRLGLQKGESGTQSYVLRLMERDSVRKLHRSSTSVSDAEFAGSSLIPGKSRKLFIKVPKHSHTYSLNLDSTAAGEAAVKLFFVPRKRDREENLATIEPISFDRVVHLAEKDKLIPYYVSTRQRSVAVRIIGPTRMKVRARMNFTTPTDQIETYRIVVTKDGKKLSTKTLASKHSEKMEYGDWKGITPGILNTFYVPVATGEHTYRFELGEGAGESTSFKVSIPQADTETDGGDE